MEAIVTPKLGCDAVEQLRSKGKNPHFRAEKAINNTQKQFLEVTGPLTCLWVYLLNKEAKVAPEDVVLLVQGALVLQESASHYISVERSKLVWAELNPKLRRLDSEEYNERGTDLFAPGFLEKASKRLKVEKTLTKQVPQNSKRESFESDNSDLKSFYPRALKFSMECKESPYPTVHFRLQLVPERKKAPLPTGGTQPEGQKCMETQIPGQALRPIPIQVKYIPTFLALPWSLSHTWTPCQRQDTLSFA